MTNLSERVTELAALKGLLPESRQGFAESLVDNYKKRGKLSMKQAEWVDKLIYKALTDTGPEIVELGTFEGVVALLSAAHGKLKYPKLNLATKNGNPIQLSRAGQKAKVPGSINVTNGGPFGDNIWYGRVTADGKWEKYEGDKVADTIEEVAELLQALANDPSGVATNHGHTTGACCFCNKKLKQTKSVAVGFGETCAKNWGLHSEWKAAAKTS